MKKVLCFGDSNTFGFMPSSGLRYDKNSRWSGILQSLCKDNFKIVEAGCTNRTAFADNPDGELYCGAKVLPKILKPDVDYLVISLGINDLQVCYNLSLGDFEKGMTDLINSAYKVSSHVKIVLVCPPEIESAVLTSPLLSTQFDEISIEKSRHLKEIYSKIANKTGCKLVNLSGVVPVSGVDGLHFEKEGHKKIAQLIYESLL